MHLVRQIFSVLLLVAAFLANTTYAQFEDVEFTRLDVQNGQFQTTTYSIAQDSLGFIWLASQDGLQVYDGSKYIEFRHNPSDPHSISSNSISSIIVDSKNNVWIGTWGGGISIYNRKTGKFIVYKHSPKNKRGLPHNRVQSLFEDKDGTIWAGTAGGGLCRFNSYDSSFYTYPIAPASPNAISHGRIWSITQDFSGLIWVGTQEGLNTLDPKTGIIRRIVIKSIPNLIGHTNLIRTLFTRKNGDVWAGTQNGIFVFQKGKDAPFTINLPYPDVMSHRIRFINCFFEMRDRSMLIGTYGAGLYYYNELNGKIQSHQYSAVDNNSLSSNDVRCIMADKSGLIWIGTRSGSIATTKMQPKRFSSITDESWKGIYIPDKFIRSALYDSKGNLWIGTNESGLYLLAAHNKSIRYIKRGNFDLKFYSDRVVAITEDNRGRIWFTCDDGIYYTDNLAASINKYEFAKGSELPIRTESLRQFQYLENRFIIIGSNGGGILLYDQLSAKWNVFSTKNKFPSDDISFLLTDSHTKTLWIGTGNGLVQFNYHTKQFTVFGNGSGEYLRNNPIYAITKDNDRLWLGTSDGLLQFNITSKQLKKLETGIDLNSPVISGIAIDKKGMLWLATFRGITRLNPVTKISKSFSHEDGLQRNTYTPGAYSKNSNGTVVFGGGHGLTIFNPDHLDINYYQSPVGITGFEIMGNDTTVNLMLPIEVLYKNHTFNLQHNQDNFRVSFTTFNFQYPDKNRFFYQLVGIEDTWRDAGIENSVTYSHVPPGHYTFRVKAFNNDMNAMPQIAEVSIIINPPFYATLWFRGLVIIIILSGFAGLFYYRIKNLEKRRSLLEKEVASRTEDLLLSEQALKQANAAKDKFFSIIAHDLRSPFQALLSYSSLINSDDPDITTAEKKELSSGMEKVAKQTYELLENLLKWAHSQTNKLSIHPKELILKTEIENAVQLIEQQANIKGIKIETELQADISLFADPDMVNTILRNIIINAIKFTHDGGLIRIQSYRAENAGCISITDSGIGMTEEKVATLFSLDKNTSTRGTNQEKGSGLGLILCKELVELQQGEMLVNSIPGKGTTFIVKLPLYNG